MKLQLKNFNFTVNLNEKIANYGVVNEDFAGQLGISVWYFVLVLSAVTSFLIVRDLRKPAKKAATLPP